MNLYLFNANDSAATYGIGTYLNELATSLENSFIHIHIIYLHADHTEFEIVKNNRVETWFIPDVQNNNTFIGAIRKMEDYYRNVIYLLRLNIKDTTDLVFHFNYNNCHALAKGLKKVFECKTVITIHFMKWSLELQGNLQKLHTIKSIPENKRSSIEQLLYTTDEYERIQYGETDHLIALSQDTKQILSDEYQIDPNKISVIPSGLKDFNNGLKTDRNFLRHKWRIPQNEFLILFAGRLHEVKGLIFLIDAFRKVLDKIPESHLIIVGSGDFKSYMHASKSICTKVTFTGFLEKEELHELYQIANVGVMPSLFETFGYVAVEMMMHELPIVATVTSSLNEIIDESCGIKFPIIECSDRVEVDTDLLTEKIIFLYEHPEEAKRMGENARKWYIEKYTLSVFRENMLAFYRSLFLEK